jgi:hypothetical protein
MSRPICPRCSGYIPNDAMPGAYPGALSRLDNETEICSECGSIEAMEQFLDGSVTDWRKQSTQRKRKGNNK